MNCGFRSVALLFACLACCTASRAGEPRTNPDEVDRARRLESMKLSATQYTIRLRDGREDPLKLVDTLVLRWSNPENAATDGTIFLWTHRGRPAVALGLFTYDNEKFSHECQSLTTSPLSAANASGVVWSPSAPGIHFSQIENAEAPAATSARRLRQMKDLAARFNATFVGFAENQNPIELRLLTKPLYRYGTDDDPMVVDGGLFAYVQGTDPQLLLLLEARKGAEMGWHFAFARAASGEVTASYEGRDVFSVPKYDFRADPKGPFLILRQQPVPE